MGCEALRELLQVMIHFLAIEICERCIGLEDNFIVSKVIWFRMLHVYTMEMK